MWRFPQAEPPCVFCNISSYDKIFQNFPLFSLQFPTNFVYSILSAPSSQAYKCARYTDDGDNEDGGDAGRGNIFCTYRNQIIKGKSNQKEQEKKI